MGSVGSIVIVVICLDLQVLIAVNPFKAELKIG